MSYCFGSLDYNSQQSPRNSYVKFISIIFIFCASASSLFSNVCIFFESYYLSYYSKECVSMEQYWFYLFICRFILQSNLSNLNSLMKLLRLFECWWQSLLSNKIQMYKHMDLVWSASFLRIVLLPYLFDKKLLNKL